MNRWLAVLILASAVTAFGLIVAASFAPAATRAASDACTWQTNGQTITIDGVEYLCLCERVAAIDEVWCSWIRSTRKAHRAVKRPARLVVRLAVRAVPR